MCVIHSLQPPTFYIIISRTNTKKKIKLLHTSNMTQYLSYSFSHISLKTKFIVHQAYRTEPLMLHRGFHATTKKKIDHIIIHLQSIIQICLLTFQSCKKINNQIDFYQKLINFANNPHLIDIFLLGVFTMQKLIIHLSLEANCRLKCYI